MADRLTDEQIAALEARLDRGSSPEGCCVECGSAMTLPFGLDPTPECNSCAQSILEEVRNSGLLAEVRALRETLESVEDYFDQRADADAVGDPQRYVGNAEMGHLVRIRAALAGVRAGEKA